MGRIRAFFRRNRPYVHVNPYCGNEQLIADDLYASCKYADNDAMCSLSRNERIAWGKAHGWQRGCTHG